MKYLDFAAASMIELRAVMIASERVGGNGPLGDQIEDGDYIEGLRRFFGEEHPLDDHAVSLLMADMKEHLALQKATETISIAYASHMVI